MTCKKKPKKTTKKKNILKISKPRTSYKRGLNPGVSSRVSTIDRIKTPRIKALID